MATASSSEALQFFHEPLTTDHCTRFKVDLGDAKGQQYWGSSVSPGGASNCGVPCCPSHWQSSKSRAIRSQLCSAQRSLASSSPLLAGIVPEIALVLELHNIEEVVTQHVHGKLNDVADKLSRLAQPGVSQQLLPQLRGAKRRVTPKRDDTFFRSWAAAVGPARTARMQV